MQPTQWHQGDFYTSSSYPQITTCNSFDFRVCHESKPEKVSDVNPIISDFTFVFQVHRRFTEALTLVIQNSEGCIISPNKRKSMVVALNGAQDFLAEDLLDITKENEIENAAVSEAAALSSSVIARKLTEHAAYSTSLFPRITQV